MDPAALAATAAALLATKAIEGLGGQAGQAAWGSLTRLADALRARFTDDGEVDAALDSLEKRPGSDARTGVFAELLEDRLRGDPQFADQLDRLVREAQDVRVRTSATDVGIFAGGNITLTANGGGEVVGRDKIGADQHTRPRSDPHS